MTTTNTAVLRTDRLDEGAIEALISEQVLAIVVPSFADRSIAQTVGEKIAASDEIEKYFYEVSENGERRQLFLGVSRYGTSFSTTFGRSENGPELKHYYEVASKNIKRLRSLFSPNLSPIDHLRLIMDESWRYGANIAHFQGRKMFAGIARITHPGMDLQERNPHVDSLPPQFDIEAQFSANIYLTMPDSGGELLLWNRPAMSAAEVDDFEANQKLWSASLGEPISIKPEIGDLILINTRKPHAVKRFDHGTRVSIQTFIGFKPGESLKLWC